MLTSSGSVLYVLTSSTPAINPGNSGSVPIHITTPSRGLPRWVGTDTVDPTAN